MEKFMTRYEGFIFINGVRVALDDANEFDND